MCLFLFACYCMFRESCVFLFGAVVVGACVSFFLLVCWLRVCFQFCLCGFVCCVGDRGPLNPSPSNRGSGYIEERVNALGCELAAAHFIVHRGGKVLQKGSNEWIEKDDDEEYCLPRHFTPDFFVECIDASGTQLRYEGLECMGNLEYLKWLNLANCTFIDDWCVDRVCGQFANSLEYLNLSNCTRISERGFAALARLKKLKTLDVTGLHNISNVQLLCLLIEDVIPDINIIGINYMELPSSAGE
ncbi:distal membrane-arm assembly complex protein 2 isoform X2 [Macrobrachium rosenbergii]|uniref:distal membrane-arm assembly complex protein 2 isoform X2 n=1 Tax=Macrobrachium rosenbergii TaxID=79674 RepID=UPI0034D5CFCD